MPQLQLKLPSGARGTIRGLKGEEVNLFANRQSSKRGRTAQSILKNVWVETEDPGPLYGEGLDWDNAPQCDRFVALFYARIATYGSEYSFKYQCEDRTQCGRRFEWTLDLLDDMTIKDLPEESIAQFQDRNRFRTTITDNEGEARAIVFQLMTPKLEQKVEQVTTMAPKERTTAGLAQRIVSVAGIEESGRGPIKAFLNDLDAGAILDLADAMDEVDGGVETMIDIECPHCGCLMEVDLPLREGFWSPSRRRRSTKR
jgi:hypothetical protein